MARLVVELDASQVKSGTAAIKKALGEVGASSKSLRVENDKTSKSIKAQEREFNRLARSIDPAFRRTQDMASASAVLKKQLDANRISLSEHNRLLGLAGDKFDGSRSSAANLIGTLKATALAYVGIGTALALVRGSLTEVLDAERQVALIGNSIRNLGRETDITTESARRFAAAYGEQFTFDDDQVLAAERALIRFGVTSQSVLEQATTVAGDVARSLGVDLVQAAEMVGKAMQEPGEGLGQLKKQGLAVSDSAVIVAQNLAELSRTAEAQTVVLRAVGAEAKNTAGSQGELAKAVDELDVSWADFLQTLGSGAGAGGGVLGAAASGLDTLSGAVQNLDRYLAQLQEKSGILAEIARAALTPFTGGLGWTLGRGGRDAAQAPPTPDSSARLSEAQLQLQASRIKLEAAFAKALKASTAAEEDRAREAAAAAKAMAAVGQAILDRLNPIAAAERKAAEELETLTTLQQRGAISASQLAAATGTLAAELQALKQAAFDAGTYFEAGMKFTIPPATIPKLKELAVTTGEVKTEIKGARNEWDVFMEALNEDAMRQVGAALSDSIVIAFDDMDAAADNFGDALIDIGKRWLADLITQWLATQAQMLAASLQRIAAEKAAQQAANAAAGGGGGGGGISMAGMGGGGGGWMSTAFSTSGGGGMAGIAWPVLLIAAVAAAANYFNKKEEAKQFESGASVHSDNSFGGFNVYQGGTNKSSKALADALREFWSSFQTSTGAMVGELGNLAIKVRHDQEAFRVEVEGVVIGTYKDMNEAIVAGIKAQFTTASFANEVDPAIRSLVASYTGKDPKELQAAIGYVQGLVDAASGLSDVEIALRRVNAEFQIMEQQLRNMGVSAGQAAVLAAGNTIERFRDAWHGISGQQVSPEEEMALKERQRSLLLAQLRLLKIELQTRAALLAGEAKVVQGTTEVTRIRLRNGVTEVEGAARVATAEAQVLGSYLRARGSFVQAQGSIFQAEVDALNEYIRQIDLLIADIEIGDIKIGKGRGGGGGLGGFGNDRVRTALERLISAITRLREFQEELRQDQQLSPYTLQQRYGMALADYNRIAALAQAGNLDAIEDLPDAARLMLELAAQMFGTAGSGYQAVFDGVQNLLESISDQYPRTEDFRTWLRSELPAIKRFLEQIRNNTTPPRPAPPPGGYGFQLPNGAAANANGSQPMEARLAKVEQQLSEANDTNRKLLAAVEQLNKTAKEQSSDLRRAVSGKR